MPEDYDWRVVWKEIVIKRYGEQLASIIKEWWQKPYPSLPNEAPRPEWSRFDEPLCSERCGYKFGGVCLHSPCKGKVYAYCILYYRDRPHVTSTQRLGTFWHRYIGEVVEEDLYGLAVYQPGSKPFLEIEIPRSELETMLGLELKPCPPRSETPKK